MAANFYNKKATLGTGSTTVYTVPSATTAIVIGCQIGNRHTASVNVDLWWTDSSDSDNTSYLADDVVVPEAAAYEPIGGKLVLETGDALKGLASTGSVADVTLSILELT